KGKNLRVLLFIPLGFFLFQITYNTMKWIFLLLLSYAPFLGAQELNCDCQKDLDFLYETLPKAPSFKAQIKGNRKAAFETHYRALRAQSSPQEPLFNCFMLLVELMRDVKDNHLRINYSTQKFSPDSLKDAAFVERFKKSEAYLLYPASKRDLDSLEKVLSLRPVDSLAGIYYYKNIFKMAVFQKENSDRYQGVLLESKLASWQRGDVLMELWPEGDNRLFCITGNLVYKRLLHFPEAWLPGQFLKVHWTKEKMRPSYHDKGPIKETYGLVDLNEQVQYLKLGSFNSFGQTLRDADAFFDKIENQLKAPQLIVDLRDNSGGGPRSSQQFFKLLKSYNKNHQLYVLINYGTTSQAEHFALKLKRLGGVQLLGRPSNGTLAYGRNKPSRYPFPSKKFDLLLTDSSYPIVFPFEQKGIIPDISLDYDQDWLEQSLEILQKP
ncbi:MAG: S41 family peptidase, partial [Bacteroidota bacterium]